MRASNFYFPTLREVPNEAEITSHQLMLRAAIMKKLAAGVYIYMPFGLKALRKVERIVREEMDAKGSLEVLMSGLIPSELLVESGRWSVFGPEMFKLQDRNERTFCLGPTHEEVFTDMIRGNVKSYKQLPIIAYQIQTKYRDEIRPRFGVMRSKEFIMKDAYSFDKDEEGLDVSYEKMRDAYCKIFDRCELDYRVVQADSGAMGGSGSAEFMVRSEVGEDYIAYCSDCDYAANIEKAECVMGESYEGQTFEHQKIHTPGITTIEGLSEFFGKDKSHFLKCVLYKSEGKVYAGFVRGDRELNETKFFNKLGLNPNDVEMAGGEDIARIGSYEGYTGPLNLKADGIIIDREAKAMGNFYIGANEKDYHIAGIDFSRDLSRFEVADIRTIVAGDKCPKCGGSISIEKGIEVGHIFKLGTKYSDALNAKFLDVNGKEQPMIMGSYGIGVNRTVAAVIEHHNDENGIIWPLEVAPFVVAIVQVNSKDEDIARVSEGLYNDLLARGIDVLLDDRDERAGVKFKDMDLLGMPIRITVGKLASEGKVEWKLRKGGEVETLSIDDAVSRVMKMHIDKNMPIKNI